VGCRRDTATEAFEKFVLATLAKFDISLKAVSKLASIDLKRNENCLINFCEKYNIQFATYTAEGLAAVVGEFTASAFVKKTTGVDNVCERSAMCDNDGELIVKKQAQDGMTIAIACRNWRCEF
jgi:cobalt-precorrin 5A hydrolase